MNKYQIYQLTDGEWIEWGDPIAFDSRRQAMAFIRLRFRNLFSTPLVEGCFKVRKD